MMKQFRALFAVNTALTDFTCFRFPNLIRLDPQNQFSTDLRSMRFFWSQKWDLFFKIGTQLRNIEIHIINDYIKSTESNSLHNAKTLAPSLFSYNWNRNQTEILSFFFLFFNYFISLFFIVSLRRRYFWRFPLHCRRREIQ